MSKMYSTAEAAIYCELPQPTFEYHVYQGHVPHQKIGNSLAFTAAALDQFKADYATGIYSRPGRPSTKGQD